MTSRLWRVFAGLLVAVVAIISLPPAHSGLQAWATLQVVVSGLVNPRGLNFGPDGALYVAEAGSGGGGPCYTNGAGAQVCYGPTGAVTKITLGDTATKTRVIAGLPSVAPTAGPAAGTGATGPHDVDFQGLGNGYVTIGLGTDPANRTLQGSFPAFASVGSEFGRLIRFQPNGKWSFQEDLAGFEAKANPDGFVPDSNPYGLLALPSRQVFTDAGGNSLNAVAANGKITNLAVFPSRMGVPGAPPTGMQAVPTGLTVGPDGAFYVGQLTGGPFPLGGANVYRVPATGGTPVVYATGFTKIIDVAFGPDGSLYVLQISNAGGGPPQGTPPLNYRGSLLRVPPGGGTATTIVGVADGLINPGGIAIADDGSIYVTNYSIQPGGVGTVVKITP